MATETQTVTGVITRPDGTSLSAGIVRFTLSRVDPDQTNDEVVIPPVVDAVIGNDGSISVGLWPNTLGFYGTSYKVHVIRAAEAGQETTLIGRIQVGESGPYELTDLLVAGGTPAEDSFYSVLTEAEYNAAIAAKDAAEASAVEASLYDGPKVDTYGDLSAVTSAQVGPGKFIRVIQGGAILQGVASGQTITTAGGAKLVVVRGPEFNTRSAATLLEISRYPNGTIGRAAGNQYTTNSALTGAASDGYDVGVNGIELTGNAATHLVQEDSLDTTPDSVPLVGAFGIGRDRDNGVTSYVSDLNDKDIPTGLHQYSAIESSNVPSIADNYGALVQAHRADGVPIQLLIGHLGTIVARGSNSSADGVWNSWAKMAKIPTTVANGDIFYASSGQLQRLPLGSAGQVLTVNAGGTGVEWA